MPGGGTPSGLATVKSCDPGEGRSVTWQVQEVGPGREGSGRPGACPRQCPGTAWLVSSSVPFRASGFLLLSSSCILLLSGAPTPVHGSGCSPRSVCGHWSFPTKASVVDTQGAISRFPPCPGCHSLLLAPQKQGGYAQSASLQSHASIPRTPEKELGQFWFQSYNDGLKERKGKQKEKVGYRSEGI